MKIIIQILINVKFKRSALLVANGKGQVKLVL